MAKQDITQTVTDALVAQLEAGVAPWVKPWDSALSLPVNAWSGRAYRGGNVVMLWSRGFHDPRWTTFNQAKAKGGSVRKGEKGTPVVFWSMFVKHEGTQEEQRIPFARTFVLFNVEQCTFPEGVLAPLSAPEPSEPGAVDKLAAARGAVVCLADKACFRIVGDTIGMPQRAAFTSEREYDATLAHELIHWTGHESRLARTFGKRFGDQAYAAEELVAELGAAFLCARLGIPGSLQHASYLAAWIKLLKSDKHAIFTAAKAAEAAVEYLLPTEAVEAEEEAA